MWFIPCKEDGPLFLFWPNEEWYAPSEYVATWDYFHLDTLHGAGVGYTIYIYTLPSYLSILTSPVSTIPGGNNRVQNSILGMVTPGQGH